LETQVRTPQLVFMQPQRLIVPLFQRPYVWNQESQWEPLWDDVVRVTERLLKKPHDRQQPHFLGAVVLQQAQRPTGLMQERTIIDGQQRLTTLQLLLDALHAELVAIQAVPAAQRLEPLVENASAFRSNPEDRFKVWPTNRDRKGFNAVMSADPSDDSSVEPYRNERMVECHRFFRDEARRWLSKEGADPQVRATAVETAVRELLQMVVIDLTVDENAQEIFETLNARGAQLTAADLIKNFVFQRLMESKADVESAYQQYWKEFETGFWETEISTGRIRYPRSAVFLNHWLISRIGEEVVAREVFSRFKSFADYDAGVPMSELLVQIHRAAQVYREFVSRASNPVGPVDRLALFGYRTSVLESEVIKPLVLLLLDPEMPAVPEAQLVKALNSIESWMVRRMLVRAGTKSYTKIIPELIRYLRSRDRATAGDSIEQYLANQSSDGLYWPDDAELKEELTTLPAYRRMSRGRLRMVLEAVEDHLRGWRDARSGLGGERVARASYAIEHVLPRKWPTHWPLPPSGDEATRDKLLHTLGNLTLLTQPLNSKVSNGPWQGDGGKRAALQAHDVLLLNRELLKAGVEDWSEERIQDRTQSLIATIASLWPVPVGHRSARVTDRVKSKKLVRVNDLLAAGVLLAGMPLFPRRKQFSEHVATLLGDGKIEMDSKVFDSPSEAASSLVGHAMNGWWFFLVERGSKRSLKNVRRDYVKAMSVETDDDESDDEDDES